MMLQAQSDMSLSEWEKTCSWSYWPALCSQEFPEAGNSEKLVNSPSLSFHQLKGQTLHSVLYNASVRGALLPFVHSPKLLLPLLLP